MNCRLNQLEFDSATQPTADHRLTRRLQWMIHSYPLLHQLQGQEATQRSMHLLRLPDQHPAVQMDCDLATSSLLCS